MYNYINNKYIFVVANELIKNTFELWRNLPYSNTLSSLVLKNNVSIADH